MSDVYNDTLKKLEEIRNKYNQYTIPVMDEAQFEQHFAQIYGAINHYYSTPPSTPFGREPNRSSGGLMSVACQVLEASANYLVESGRDVSQQSVKLYGLTVELLSHLLVRDFGMTEARYKEALHLSMMVRARKACDIWEHGSGGHISGRYDFSDPEALSYVSQNVAEFARWIYSAGRSGFFEQDPMRQEPDATALTLFARVAALKRASIRIAA
ncbi:hypothetical protein [Burkholderia ubonensis]|uniref:hypothetical protein n=1 Tax=Burkholderia ubonensis TaxID=101571 RepID=UPI000F59C624|nr:hypothetical protein [Burkholderia ubonensis]